MLSLLLYPYGNTTVSGLKRLKASLVVLGTSTGTCDKVLVAKTKSFSAVIDTLCHLHSETLSVWTIGFYVQVSPFGTIWRICIL